MSLIYGISGSTILSDIEKFDYLLNYNMDHIEIGEFKNIYDAEIFYKKIAKKNCTHGIHSPFIRGKSKYSFIEDNDSSIDEAFKNLRNDAEIAKKIGSQYLLLHFPYINNTSTPATDKLIEEGLKKIYKIQREYDIEIICEPKIGTNKSAFGINCLENFPYDIWKMYGLGICIDVGDYLLAVNKNTINYISKWKDYIRVVHLHNIEVIDDKYYWRPIHPENEIRSKYKIKPIIEYLMKLDSIKFILEHTPHGDYSKKFIEEGISWLKSITITNEIEETRVIEG